MTQNPRDYRTTYREWYNDNQESTVTTVTIDLSPETEARLTRRAAALGEPLHDLVVDLVEQAASRSSFEGRDVVTHLRGIGVIGAVRGKKRADGRSSSKVEAACDTH